MKLWFVDDKRDNHETWTNSFAEPLVASCEFRSFFSIPELIDELENGNAPDILFIDFFIGEFLGIEVIKWFENTDGLIANLLHSQAVSFSNWLA